MSSDTEYTVGQFMEDVKAILREKGSTDEGLGEIAQRMQALSSRSDLLEQGPIRIIPPGREGPGGLRLVFGPRRYSDSGYCQVRP